MPNLLARFFRRHREEPDRGPFIGFGFDFSNDRLGLKAVGFPTELLASFEELNKQPQEVASDRGTGIASFPVYQRSPKIEFHGGPHAEAVFDLFVAIEANDARSCAEILERDPALFTDAHDGSCVPLVDASAAGNEAIAQLLLESGASPDDQGLLGMSPLHWAAALGHARLVELLISNGANPSLLNWSLLTPAELAVANHHDDVVFVFGHSGIAAEVPTPQVVLSRMGCRP